MNNSNSFLSSEKSVCFTWMCITGSISVCAIRTPPSPPRVGFVSLRNEILSSYFRVRFTSCISMSVCPESLFLENTSSPSLFHISFRRWEAGGGAFFKIPTLIGVDTQPPHECIWRNVPIFKTNDDCLAPLRKMGLPGRPQHHTSTKPKE